MNTRKMDNIVLNPMFEDAPNYNFMLQEESKAIDAGSFLTTATGAGIQSDQLVVADATYFCDGFGIRNGDLIQFENQDVSVEVTGINYTTNTLTLNSAMSWDAGDGVSLKYSGTSPDIGVFEFQEALFDPDSDGDGDVDGLDLTALIGGPVDAHLVAFANAYGTVP